ncbi:uncharacterized protein BYT42DRAFT_549736 [Radiomyces spectabilis]|uniref:uncharacterized protein n=1 Tax=Radiomyces spectabilis TaxID=64574 RepID=UPI00221FF080|nr:uncharacterized protein BYT42DRAFT_549736 [Radiomyces spectabilis]KAI8366648.1 hypothetical protein BYT42DRAFT_549736 [Radiomyces spectabilis]
MTASRLLFGYELRTPGTWPAPREDFVEDELAEEVANRVETIQQMSEEARVIAREKVRQKQLEAKKRYDKHVYFRRPFAIGEQVLMKDHVTPTKFSDRWLGPMTVAQQQMVLCTITDSIFERPSTFFNGRR